MASAPPFSAMRWARRIEVTMRRRRWLPRIEVATLILLGLVLVVSYLILTGGEPGQRLLTPPFVALLLVANLIPAIALIVLAGRRMAKARAASSAVGGSGRLHVRLVALFSAVASIPVLLLVIFASLLFQYGVEFWYSDRARTMFENANTLAQTSYREKQDRIVRETELMASDLSFNLSVAPIDSKPFNENFAYQVYMRELSEAAIVRFSGQGAAQSLALVNPYERPTDNWVPPSVVAKLRQTKRTVFEDAQGRMQAITPLPGTADTFVYAARVSSPEALAQTQRFSVVLKNYNDLVERSRRLQLQFNAALFLVTLLIVGVAVWVALAVADRLVAPVGDLVNAARRVTAGDLSARVKAPGTRDEIGLLSSAFNQMTGTLEAQRRDLVDASELADRRRAFTEAVLSGVTAGVLAVDGERQLRIMNRQAQTLLASESVAGTPLATIAPELDELLANDQREAIVEIVQPEGPRTLAVRIAQDESGHVLTFDDITAQLADQRRAAWADVARRIAHEIKNPLTPIQLAAERLKRRFSKEIASDAPTFDRLVDTIVRQVGDLRRMVDEFSSFARMPKPIFREEPLIDIVRPAVFLHEVAHPGVNFGVQCDDPAIAIVCDRRQLGQAMTNLVKNGVEAIAARGEPERGAITITIAREDAGKVSVTVADDGIGLPKERERLAEPYMTTRARGTGLGLAIVKKIAEDHGATLEFDDRPGGGTVVRLCFDPVWLAALAERRDETDSGDNPKLVELTRAGSQA